MGTQAPLFMGLLPKEFQEGMDFLDYSRGACRYTQTSLIRIQLFHFYEPGPAPEGGPQPQRILPAGKFVDVDDPNVLVPASEEAPPEDTVEKVRVG